MVRNLVVAVLVTTFGAGSAWGADIQESHIFYFQEYQDGVALDKFWFASPIAEAGIQSADIDWNIAGEEEYLLLDFPATDSWNIAWNFGLVGEEDDIDIMPNITFPTGVVTIDCPADGAEFNPTYEWMNNSTANALTATVFEIIGFDDEIVYNSRRKK